MKVMVFLFFVKHVEIYCEGIQDLGLYIYSKYSINIELNLLLLHFMQISLFIRRDKLDNYSIFTGINLLATEQLLYSRCCWLEYYNKQRKFLVMFKEKKNINN